MHGRGGFPVKNVIFAVFIVLLIYMTYLYNGSQNRLRESEMTGARYKREADDRVTEIQDLVRAKDKAQEAWQNEKFELNNRIKSINQQHSMLQGQYKEIEADLVKLKDDMSKMSEAQQNTLNKHSQEFQVMKQEKENEINTLQNKVADMEREKSENTRLIQQFKDKLIQLETDKAQLENENKILKQQLSQADASKILGQQGQHQPQQQNQQQILKTTPSDLFPQQGDQQKFGQKNSPVEHMQMESEDAVDKANPFKNFDSLDNKNDLNHLLGRGGGVEADKNKEAVEELNAQHQMIAPGRNQQLNNDDEQVRSGGVKRSDDLDKRPDVNPNDEQKGQILEPGLDLPELGKAKGDEEDKKGEEKDTNVVRVDDEGDDEKLEHKIPLALGQIQGPQPGVGEAHKDHKEAAQQQPPILNENNDRLEDKNAGVGKDSMSNVVNPVAPGEMLK